MKHWVYLLYSGFKLIYVGMTNNIDRRLSEHGKHKYTSVGMITCDNKQSAMQYERLMIGYFQPELNSMIKEKKDTVSVRLKRDLKQALKREADKEKRTFSWYLESLVEEIAKKKKIAA